MIVILLLMSCQSDQSTKEELLGEGDTGTSTGESQEQILQENLLEDGLEHLQNSRQSLRNMKIVRLEQMAMMIPSYISSKKAKNMVMT